MRFAAPLLMVLMVASVAAGQADLSTPKSAAKSLYDAILRGDRAAARAALYAADDAQHDYADAMAEMIVAGKALGDAARANFGAAGAAIGKGALDPADAAKLEQATVEQKGDAATIKVPGQPRPMSFRRAPSGEWGLVVYDTANAPQTDIARQTKLVRLLAEAMQTSAGEISSGAFKTAEEATTALQQRLHGVMLSFHRPSTTRATTTTAPARK